jgi:hypothetical protein
MEIIIRHFTDTPEQKRERSQLREGASRQVKAAEERSIRAAEYHAVRDRILRDHYRASAVKPDKVVPELSTKEIAELREYAERLSPYSSDHRDFEATLSAPILGKTDIEDWHMRNFKCETREI